MFVIDDILGISSSAEFERAALELFTFQARECQPYHEYLALAGIDPAGVRSFADIPYLPIEIFKTHRVYCGAGEPEIVFTSSSTGGAGESKHYVARTEDYEKTFRRAFGMFYDQPAKYGIYALLPGYLEREGSSLIYMMRDLVGNARTGGFYLHDHDRLIRDMEADHGPKILFGVSYALWDLAELKPPRFNNLTVMETGGMKGHREELAKDEFHDLLCNAFGIRAIHSEYGMAELSSQAYSAGENIFRCPPWMRISLRDLNDPFETLTTGRGGVNIADLANINSCAFIQTQDIGTLYADGSFSVLGRADRSDIRGCNLLVG
ncbi:acyltransferase [Alistipes sp. OttesenSCG-928-B03]|nr:acyltransferase [Alistipes sp. OttesenSCG-928-B03]